MKIVRQGAPGFEGEFAALEQRQVSISGKVSKAVEKILADVRTRGDAALFDYTRRFDGVSITPKSAVIPKADLRKAYEKVSPSVRAALRAAAARILKYHERQRRQSWSYQDSEGARMGLRFTPLEAVMLYVPGGKAAYPSTLLMTAIPAKVAGVKKIFVASPGASLKENPAVLAAAHVAGVSAVYRVGGAQAVGAFAYGTKSIPRVSKIVGPGNAYVAEAKRQVFGTVGIDQLAGPSEIVVVSDGSVPARRVAWDLMSQAEHDELATAVLLTNDLDFAGEVSAAVRSFTLSSPRQAILRKSLAAFGRIFVLKSLSQAPALVNRLAPEHVELCVKNPEAWLPKIRHAGAIFLGPWTPEAVGDYVAGSNHVLPTGGAARFGSPLGVDDFLKKTSTVAFSERALRRLGPAVVALAEAEGLVAHAASVSVRLGDLKETASRKEARRKGKKRN